MTSTVIQPKGRVRQMGKVTTTLVLANRIDVVLSTRGLLPRERVRTVELREVLVDTGATILCLPADLIARLGLESVREVTVETALGTATARIFRDVSLNVEGREGTFECLELPVGREPLLGVIPLETLGIELDLQNQRIHLLPDSGSKSYYTA